MHVFESRKAAFNEADVLQENVIIHAAKTRIKPQTVTIFTSGGKSEDMVAYHENLRYEKIVLPDDVHSGSFTLSKTALMTRFNNSLQSLPTRLDHMGLSASTGRVVDFRAADLLLESASKLTRLLHWLYPQHLQQSRIQWPNPKAKFNALTISEDHRDLFVPNYQKVLIKRFTAKEEKRRVVAAVHFKGDTRTELLGIENHLNYVHHGGRGT